MLHIICVQTLRDTILILLESCCRYESLLIELLLITFIACVLVKQCLQMKWSCN